MKNLKNFLIMITIFMFLLVGCSGKADFESRLVGTWYTEGSSEAAFSLYDDGTCEIAGEYGTGTWSVVNDNQFKLTNYYGETDTATIVGIENNCLTLGDENNQVQFWNSPQTTNNQTSAPVNEDENNSNIEGADNSDMVEDSKDSNLLSLYQTEVVDLGEFISGVTTVLYRIDGEMHRAMFNQQGTFITETDGDCYNRDIVSGACYNEEKVVDIEGNTVFTAQDTQRIMCVGDSMILVYEDAMGFESAEARIGVVNFDGEWIYPMTSDNLMIDDEKMGIRYENYFRYAGEGCFMVNGYDDIFKSGKKETIIFDVNNKTSALYDGIISEANRFGKGMINRGTQFLNHIGETIREVDDYVCYFEEDGLYYCYNQRKLFDYSGEIVKDYSQYENGDISFFLNGYGYFTAKGADGNDYFSIVDSKGDFLFDPIIKERSYSNEPNGFFGDFHDGEFITDQKSFDISGNMIYDFGEVITGCSEGIVTVGDKYMTTHGELVELMIPQE